MSAPVSTTSHRRTLWRRALLAAALATATGLAVLGVGFAEASAQRAVTGATPVPSPETTPPAGPGVRLLGTYHLRCWQDGRLLLDEPLTQAPPDGAAQSLRLQGSAAAGTAVTLLSSGTATCLVRPAPNR